jgi:hypothetical protein
MQISLHLLADTGWDAETQMKLTPNWEPKELNVSFISLMVLGKLWLELKCQQRGRALENILNF